MSDPVHELYQSRPYPSMSHPSTDPAITAVSAKLAGLDIPTPTCAHILEIGCASGHNLLPLAARWPDSHFTGIDFSSAAILDARQRAIEAGLSNVEFIEADFSAYDPGDDCYDFIIAHGIYSWVPDQVRQALLDFCAEHLSHEGIATISYNTLPGWSLRKSLVALTDLISQRPAAAEIGKDPEHILAYLATAAGCHTPYARHLTAVLHDMFGKGSEILPFDDFGPINMACTFLDFTGHASRSGLLYLGESQIADNFPASLAPEAASVLRPLGHDPLALQQTIDVLTNRTFRSSILCRADAPIQTRITAATALHFSVRCQHDFETTGQGARLIGREGEELARFEHPLAVAFFSALGESAPESVPMSEIIERMAEGLKDQFDPTHSLPPLASLVMESARQNLILLRYEPVRFDPLPPAFPNLGRLRRMAAAKGQALVDIYHAPCSFEDARSQVAVAMDGTRSIDELAALSRAVMPQLDFHAWIGYLAERGMFAG